MTKRFVGFDLIRLVSFFAIATFHISLIHYYTPEIDIAGQSLVIRAVEQTARVLSFSGFTICFLTSVLTAYSGSSIRKRLGLFTFLSVGWVIFSWLMSGFIDGFLVWDIYPLIFAGIFTATLAEAAGPRVVRSLGVIGYLMLWIPFWNIGQMAEMTGGAATPLSELRLVLGLSACNGATAEWPVLPWIGLVWAGYAAGRHLRLAMATAEGRGGLAMTRGERVFWGVALVGSVPFLGDFYRINLGRYFSCEAYRQAPSTWWAHFIWPVFLMRLSVLPGIQRFLAGKRPLHWISELAISRKFWLAYLSNYLFAHVVSFIVSRSGVERTAWNVPTIAFIAVFFLPATELVVRGELWLARRLQAAFRFFRARMPREPAPSVLHGGESGVTMIVAMMATVFIGLTLSGFTIYIKNGIDGRRLTMLLDGRRVAKDFVRATASYPDALYVTANSVSAATSMTNPARKLRACVNGDGGVNGCAWTNPGAAVGSATGPVPFALKTPYSQTFPSMPVSGLNAATTTGHYSWRGMRANCAASELCPFWVKTSFWAQCPNNAASCQTAVRIFVRTQADVIPGIALKTLNLNGLAMGKLPPDQAFAANPQLEATGSWVSDILQTAIQQCPAHSYTGGVDANGLLICQCVQGFVATSVDTATNWPTCTIENGNGVCPPGQTLDGVNANGSMHCVTPPATNYTCSSQATPSTGVVNCPNAGDRMRAVTVTDECTVVSNIVHCDNMEIMCCRKN